MTAVTFVDVGTRSVNTNGAPTPGLPTAVDGDLLIAKIEIHSSTRTYTSPPAGWTYLGSIINTGGPSFHFHWKRYATGDTDPTFSVTGTSDAGKSVIGTITAWRNADTTAGPTLGTGYTSGATTGSNAGPIPGVAVTGQGVAMLVAGWNDDYSAIPALPAGYTLVRNDEVTSTNGISFHTSYIAVTSATSSAVTVTGHPSAVATRSGVQIAIHEGAQNYTGTLSITSTGTLSLGASAETASGSLTLSSTGTLSLGGKPVSVGALAITSTGTLAIGGQPKASSTLAITSTGTLTLFAGAAFGTLAITSTGTLALSPSAMTAKGSLSIASSGVLALGGVPRPKGILALTGAGLLSMSAIITTRLRWWDGSTWRPTVIRYWDGAAWQLGSLKVWDGTQWA